ncbi:MAG: hypothetical protein A2Y38_02240 [Spirochaetes bacterium GWB1_59_5]|nr:MAG: hypothetical protein A2Y38_02240 [Spirochaetes bacterium GWB1_59_5]
MFDQHGRLDIFENFRTDHDLPKFADPRGDDENLSEEESSAIFENFRPTSKSMKRSRFVNSGNITINSVSPHGDLAVVATWIEDSSWPWPWRWLRRFKWLSTLLATWLGARRERKATLSIEDFFASVKNSAEELTVIHERAKGYEAALVKAKAAGQGDLYEQLEKNLTAVRSEAQLVAQGLGRYLEEATLVQFVKQAKKGLRLDWVANFTRVVPDTVLAVKQRTDLCGIFDNYVVLHYDPQKHQNLLL